jgi:2-phosphoglycerate kinase
VSASARRQDQDDPVSASARRQGRGREVVVVRSDYGLPYSKGLMAQSIMAAGVPPERSFALARLIEDRLGERGVDEVSVVELRRLAEQVLRAEEGEPVMVRFRQWWRLGSLDRPLIVLLGGVTGVGKSTVATQLANRLGITRVIATDQVRQVVRAFFSHDFMPAVHHSSFDVGQAVEGLAVGGREATVAGFLRQVEDIAPGIEALMERAVAEGTPMVVEGVHLLPEIPDERLRSRAIVAHALLAVRDEQAHRGHFHMRALQAARPPERYLDAFERIRLLQGHLIERAEAAGVPVIDEGGLEPTLKRVMELVLDAVASGEGGDQDGDGNVFTKEEGRG